MFRILSESFTHFYLTRFRSNSRSVNPERLGEILRSVSDVPFSLHATAAEAWQAARAAAGPNDLICPTGSVYLAGELRPVLLEDAGQAN